MIRPGVIALLPALLAMAAFSGEDDYSAAYRDCIAQAAATSLASECLEKEYQLQARQLETTLRQALETLGDEGAPELLRVQKLWEAYRDAKCRFLHRPRTGSGGLLDMQQCLIDETIRRRNELEATCC